MDNKIEFDPDFFYWDENNKLNFIEFKNFSQNFKYNFDSIKDINFKFLTSKLPSTRKSTPQTAIKHLKLAYYDGNLNFILGAGISSNFGVPKWSDLLQRLLVKTIEHEASKAVAISKFFSKIFNPSPLIAGRYLQDSLGDKKDNHRFEQEVKNALYSSFKVDAESKIVDEIIRFCVAPGNTPNLDGIITYNYDDIIEARLKSSEFDVPFQTIYGQGINPDNKSLAIYHVHGYLPREGTISADNSITLGEFVYHEQYSNVYSWNNIVQINKFRDKTCLFIGTSLADPNTRRLLDIANKQRNNGKFHYIFKRKPDKIWIKEQINKILIEESKNMIDEEKPTYEVSEIIDFLVEMQSRFEEKDSESLGVKTVWVDDFEKDIPQILKKIRQKDPI